jgi:hypothetical protein
VIFIPGRYILHAHLEHEPKQEDGLSHGELAAYNADQTKILG